MTTKTAVRKTAATKSAKLIDVTLRRLAKPAGTGKVGEFILIINPQIFGSTGGNWLGGKSFPSKEAAVEAASKLGGRLAS